MTVNAAPTIEVRPWFLALLFFLSIFLGIYSIAASIVLFGVIT